jgi:hypothetical protein
MITYNRAAIMALSVPGRMAIHWSASLAAVRERRGSMTTTRVPLARARATIDSRRLLNRRAVQMLAPHSKIIRLRSSVSGSIPTQGVPNSRRAV